MSPMYAGTTDRMLVSADDVCKAMEKVLVDHLYGTVKAMAWDTESPSGDLEQVRDWHHVPNLEAISSADFPAGAIESPGLVAPPRITTPGSWEGTWRVIVGVYVRGDSHDDTASRARRWAAAVRGTVLAHRSLGGLASGLSWFNEQYAQRPEKRTARTLGGCAVSFDVTVPEAVHLPIQMPSPTPPPTVVTTHTSVTVR